MALTKQVEPKSEEDDKILEIHFNDIIAFLKRSRRSILIGALIGGILGAIYAFSKPNEYTSQVTLLPEIQAKTGSNMGGLSSLAGLAGIDVSSLAGGNDAVRPELYPTVLQSVPFALAIAKQPVFSKEYRRTESLDTYLKKKNQPSFLARFLSLFAGKPDSTTVYPRGPSTGALELTKQQEEIALYISSRVIGAFDKKSSVLTISSTMPDPIVAASTTQQALKYLTDYITSYRTEKARLEVDFLNKQVAAAKQRYQAAEVELSSYRDRNR
ncbi:MAG: lipopolysaccharide biosynthesis protein, partial [Pedobacter sp.]